MPLFNKKILASTILKYKSQINIDNRNQLRIFLQNTLQRIQSKTFGKEESEKVAFLNKMFELLGYTLSQNLQFEFSINGRSIDAVLGCKNDNHTKVEVAIEWKGIDTRDLDKGKAGETPVSQMWDYMGKVGCEIGIVGNFTTWRIYTSRTKQNNFHEFHLSELVSDNDRLDELMILLNSSNLLRGKNKLNLIERLIEEAQTEQEQITKRFYNDYKSLRLKVFDSLIQSNPIVQISDSTEEEQTNQTINWKLFLLEKTQKLLDRLVFVMFCEDTQLLPYQIIKNTYQQGQKSRSRSQTKIWEEFQYLFADIDKGRHDISPNINAFNGGLFKVDTDLDAIIITDNIWTEIVGLADYDFASDLNVNILGHIFEQSINDLETIKANIEGQPITTSKRKKDGIYYTPEYITNYIVEQTVGKWLEENKHLPNSLETITVLDPAGGSGAFPNQVHSFLAKQHAEAVNQKAIDQGLGAFAEFDEVSVDKSILKNNIFMVDLQPESVEIAKLSLWLKTARKDQKLDNLDSNIKCGNSLINDPAIAGDSAFDWEKEFTTLQNPQSSANLHLSDSYDLGNTLQNPQSSTNFDPLEGVRQLISIHHNVDQGVITPDQVVTNQNRIVSLPMDQSDSFGGSNLGSNENSKSSNQEVPLPRGQSSQNFGGFDTRTVYQQKFTDIGFTFPANKDLTERAKEMSKNMTKAEKSIWFDILNSKTMEYKWVKQKVIDNYIVDFYCHELGLVLEIDGDTHAQKQEYDTMRTQLLNHFGLEVIRYTNDDVFTKLDSVSQDLVQKIEQRKSYIQNPQSSANFDPLEGVQQLNSIHQNLEGVQQLDPINHNINYNLIDQNIAISSDLSNISSEIVPLPRGQTRKVWGFSGFDVIVGNPPYVLVQPSNIDEKTLNFYKDNYIVASYKIDLFHLFIESNIKHLTEGGYLGFITPNTYLTNKYTVELRKFILEKCEIKQIVIFDEAVFPDASVDTSILIVKKTNNKNPENQIEIIKMLAGGERFTLRKIKQSNWESIQDNIFNINQDNQLVLNNCTELGKIAQTYFGIQAFNRENSISKEKIDDTYLPLVDGSNVHDISTSSFDYYFNFRKENIKSGGDWEIYKKDRIVVRQIGKVPIVGFCKAGFLTSNTIYNIFLTNDSYDLKYILGVLNSRFIKEFWIANFSDNKQLFPKIKGYQLQQLPIPNAITTQQTEIAFLVDQIMDLKSEYNQYLNNTFKLLEAELNSQKSIDRTKKLKNFTELDFTTFLTELTKQKYVISPTLKRTILESFEIDRAKLLNLQSQINTVDDEIETLVRELYGVEENLTGIGLSVQDLKDIVISKKQITNGESVKTYSQQELLHNLKLK
jgi:very-short-patch-repair endonuclease